MFSISETLSKYNKLLSAGCFQGPGYHIIFLNKIQKFQIHIQITRLIYMTPPI